MATSDDDRRDSMELWPTAAVGRPLQFGMRTMFAVTAVVAVFAAGASAGGWYGFFGAIAALSLVVGIWADLTRRRSVSNVCCWGMVVGLVALISALLPSVGSRTLGRQTICANNLSQIGLALRSCEQKHGRLPPVFTVDQSGAPLASWRTLILPHLERERLFSKYRMEEPWDGPNNSVWSKREPMIFYQCPSNLGAGDPPHTSYVAVVGPGTAWHHGQGIKLSEITDNPADTILLVEMRDSSIHWAEPRDLDLNHLPRGVTPQNLAQSLSNHAGGFQAVFADGHVEFIPTSIPWQQLQAMFTIAGGETVDRGTW